jgi:hypothetical protein
LFNENKGEILVIVAFWFEERKKATFARAAGVAGEGGEGDVTGAELRDDGSVVTRSARENIAGEDRSSVFEAAPGGALWVSRDIKHLNGSEKRGET